MLLDGRDYKCFSSKPDIFYGMYYFYHRCVNFCFGRKLFFVRWLLGDTSMFGQLFWGLILSGIGLAIIVYYRM